MRTIAYKGGRGSNFGDFCAYVLCELSIVRVSVADGNVSVVKSVLSQRFM